MEEVKEQTSQDEIQRHLAALNYNWRYFDDIENNRILFANYFERQFVAQVASDTYQREEEWLEEHGYPWDALTYDKATRSFSLP